MPGLSTYWHTLRYLRPIQFYGRILFRVRKPVVDRSPAPGRRVLAGQRWVRSAERRRSLLGPQSFRFLNEDHKLSDGGWDASSRGKLWRYNLHYFDDLNAVRSGERTEWHHALLRRWVAENPPASGTGWEPYPTSLRIVNWIKWSLAGQELTPDCVQSLAIQARWLSGRLEIHLLANHLFANAKALVFAGLFFEGREADSWLKTGMRILEREIPEQILSDGGQFERSPMYHALALEDMCDLLNVARQYESSIPDWWNRFVSTWPDTIDSMREWLAAMCHPDGQIGLFNDAASGIAPAPAELERYARTLGLRPIGPCGTGLTHLAESGYVRVQGNEVVALIDIAPVGPDYLPGHAHADTLSFELSLFGQRVLVNSGTSCYGGDAERLRQRGTLAHNTVAVDGQNSSEVWGGFRVARRARPVDTGVVAGTEIVVRGAHDGYDRLPGNPRHAREWVFNEHSLVVTDRVSRRLQTAEARWHLHPAVTIEELRAVDEHVMVAILRLPDGHSVRVHIDGGVATTQDSTWHPEFGVSEPNVVLSVKIVSHEMSTRFTWGDGA